MSSHPGDRIERLREEIRGDLAAAEGRLNARVDRLRDEIRDELRAEIRGSAEDTRRHVDVVAENLSAQLQLVAEGVLTAGRQHERFREEVRAETRLVDGRLTRLEAKVFPPPDR